MTRSRNRSGGRTGSGRAGSRRAGPGRTAGWVAAAAAVGLGPTLARAVPIVWDKNGNATGATFNWGEAPNWNPNQVPTTDDDVTFNNTTAAIVGIVNLGGVSRDANSVTFANDTPSAYQLSNGTLVTGTINRSSPDQNNLRRTTTGTIESVSLNAPASGTIAISNTNATSFLGIQGQITALTGVTTSGAGRTVLGLTTGLTSADNNNVGAWTVNAGTLEARSIAAAGYNSLGAGAVTLAGGAVEFRSDASFNFGNAVSVTGNATLSAQRTTGTLTNQTNTIGTLSLAGQTLTVTGANGFRLATPQVVLAGDPTFNTTSAPLDVATFDAGAGSPARTITKTGDNELRVAGAGTNFTGTTTVAVNGGQLSLTNPTAFGPAATIDSSAAGVVLPAVPGSFRAIFQTGAPAAGYTYVVPTVAAGGGIIAGDSDFLNGLTAGVNINEFPEVVAQTTTGLNQAIAASKGFANDASRFFGIAGTIAGETVTIGSRTPWKGLSNDRLSQAFQTGTVTLNGDVTIRSHGGIFDFGTTVADAAAVSLVVPAGDPRRTVTVAGPGTTRLLAGSATANNGLGTTDFSGVEQFVVASGTLQLGSATTVNALGGAGPGARPAPVLVQAGGTLNLNGGIATPGSEAGNANAPVTILPGGILVADDNNNLNGTGTITMSAGSILGLSNNPFGVQSPNTVPGTTVRFLGTVTGPLDANVNDAANFVVTGAERAVTSFTLNRDPGVTPSAVLTNDGSSRTITNTGTTAVTTITIGDNGGTIAATNAPTAVPQTNTTLTFGTITGNTTGGILITGTGPLNIGSTVGIDGQASKAGIVRISGGSGVQQASTFGITVPSVNIVAGTLAGLGGGMPYNIGIGGTGPTTVFSGATFQSETGTPSNTSLIVNAGGTARFQVGGTATVGSIAGAGSIILGPATADATARTLAAGNNNLSTEFAGVISQNNSGTAVSGFTKQGLGTLNLTGNNTYRGATTVSAGTLLVNGTHGSAAAAVGNYAVNGGASITSTLGGAGTINLAAGNTVTASSATANNGIIAPGNSIGTLTVAVAGAGTTGGVVFGNNSTYLAETGTAPASDLLNVTGTGGNLSLMSVASSDTLSLLSPENGTFTIIQYGGTRTGVFDNVLLNGVSEPGTVTTDGLLTTFASNSGNVTVLYDDAVKNVQVQVVGVPEPAAVGLLATVGLGLLGRRRRDGGAGRPRSPQPR